MGDLDLYLLARQLTGALTEDPPIATPWDPPRGYDEGRRRTGMDWPSTGLTMIGLDRLANLRHCIEQAVADEIPGDLIETGVWRGGAVIWMCAVLAARGVTGRTVWAADSFDGLPPDAGTPGDRAIAAQPEQRLLAVPRAEVERNIAAYGFLDGGQVRFIEGWFDSTLPGPVGDLAVLRLDGDLYCSTMDVLTALYPKLSPGGFAIIDDWCIPNCREATEDYRNAHGVAEPIERIDACGVFWRKAA